MLFSLQEESKKACPAWKIVLKDDYELVGPGFGYQTVDFTIKDFFGYGYNDTSIIVKCTDSLNNIKYLTSYETDYKSKKGNPEISFKDLSDNDFEQVKDNYQWVELDKKIMDKIISHRTLSFVGALLSLFLIVRMLLRLINSKTTH